MSTKQEIRLCLTMIVKNEGTIIERSIRSCQPVLDAICITDTGSRKEDRTKDIITALGKEFKVPSAVMDDPWENFGHNRNRSILNAKVNRNASDLRHLGDRRFGEMEAHKDE